jgi:hypothetical protein
VNVPGVLQDFAACAVHLALRCQLRFHETTNPAYATFTSPGGANVTPRMGKGIAWYVHAGNLALATERSDVPPRPAARPRRASTW